MRRRLSSLLVAIGLAAVVLPADAHAERGGEPPSDEVVLRRCAAASFLIGGGLLAGAAAVRPQAAARTGAAVVSTLAVLGGGVTGITCGVGFFRVHRVFAPPGSHADPPSGDAEGSSTGDLGSSPTGPRRGALVAASMDRRRGAQTLFAVGAGFGALTAAVVPLFPGQSFHCRDRMSCEVFGWSWAVMHTSVVAHSFTSMRTGRMLRLHNRASVNLVAGKTAFALALASPIVGSGLYGPNGGVAVALGFGFSAGAVTLSELQARRNRGAFDEGPGESAPGLRVALVPAPNGLSLLGSF